MLKKMNRYAVTWFLLDVGLLFYYGVSQMNLAC